ncbi:GNAT family N-acetyltransferase [Tenacibaculum ovolyticum]|uniref:GNAT family N-acetyltransferase n=1 Tax=Tenacibaculum ovolyticum TaxID=104270 RepID=UPI0022F3B1E5|nr:GNAT family N-acetyltransferase [Tenacibaculum ovolyticum]WBX76220.1 GNAT family N-acetyltransferase [Tenacibaculum ovolyticum]
MKNTAIEIKQITATETLEIRHKVMWPNKPLAYVELANDKNGKHFGLFVNGETTSIVSLFTENNETQFRKFATLIEYQGFGYGTILLNKVINLIKEEKIARLWCNARVEKANFYERFDLKLTDKKFNKDGIDYVIMERIFIYN